MEWPRRTELIEFGFPAHHFSNEHNIDFWEFPWSYGHFWKLSTRAFKTGMIRNKIVNWQILYWFCLWRFNEMNGDLLNVFPSYSLFLSLSTLYFNLLVTVFMHMLLLLRLFHQSANWKQRLTNKSFVTQTHTFSINIKNFHLKTSPNVSPFVIFSFMDSYNKSPQETKCDMRCDATRRVWVTMNGTGKIDVR